jgi:hypothetical protein
MSSLQHARKKSVKEFSSIQPTRLTRLGELRPAADIIRHLRAFKLMSGSDGAGFVVWERDCNTWYSLDATSDAGILKYQTGGRSEFQQESRRCEQLSTSQVADNFHVTDGVPARHVKKA